MGASGSKDSIERRLGVVMVVVTVVVYPIDESEDGRGGREQAEEGGGECGRVRWKRVRGLLVPGSTILSPNPSSPFDN